MLQARTTGLSFRRSKDNEAKDLQTVAAWGSEVVGLDEGDGWVKVGDCFLPTQLKDVPVLRPTDRVASEAKAELSQLQGAKTRPMTTVAQGQEQSARVSTEAQLRSALAEAAEVTQAVVEHLKAERAKNQELQAKLAAQQSSSGGGARLTQLEPQTAESRKADAESGACAEEVENKRKEFEEEITELKEEAEVLTQAKAELESKLQQRESEKVSTEKRLQEVENTNRELSRKLEKLSFAAKFGATENTGVARGLAEEEVAKMNKQRERLQATMDEMIVSAQQTSIENTDNFNHLYKKIKSLKKQLEEAHEREELLRIAANATSNATGNATANVTAKAAVQREDTLGTVSDKVEGNSAKTAVAGVAGIVSNAEISEMQARVESSERKSKELAAQVKKVQAQSDQFLVMAGGQIKDIQAKMEKNNHTFQLRFEACERRNAVLAGNCDAAKQQLREEVRRLGGKGDVEVTSNASEVVANEVVPNEAGSSANASAQLLLRRDVQAGLESKAASQAVPGDALQSRSNSGAVPPLLGLALLTVLTVAH